MLLYERVSVVVSLTLIGLALYFVLAFPAQTATFILFDSPLTISSLQQWMVMLLLGGLVMAGTDAVMRVHPALPSRSLAYLATFWMLPGLLVLLATQTLGLAPHPVAWAIGLVGVGLLLWLTLVTEYQHMSAGPTRSRWPYVWQQIMGYTIALLFFVIIYRTRSRSALSATGISLISGMVALALLQYRPEMIAKTWLFAAIIALSLGQITWALNYWRSSALTAGLLLLLIFYVLVGLAQQQLLDKLSRRALWEFGSIAVVVLLVIFNFT